MNAHGRFRRFASIGLAVLVIGFGVHKWPDVRRNLSNMDLRWAAVGIALYYLNYSVRAIRLRCLLPGKLKFWPDAIWLACFHGTTTYLLPMRTGDLSLPVLLKSHFGVEILDAARVLVKARLLDVISLGAFTLTAALFLPAAVSDFFRIVWIGAGAAMVLLPAVLRFLVHFAWWERVRLVRHLAAASRISAFRPIEILLSAAIWAAVSGCLYCAARAIQLPIGLGGIFFLVTVQLPLQLIPIQGIANSGNHEGGWVLALSILGIPAETALGFALTSHGLMLVYVLAISPFLLLFRKPEAEPLESDRTERESDDPHPKKAKSGDMARPTKKRRSSRTRKTRKTRPRKRARKTAQDDRP